MSKGNEHGFIHNTSPIKRSRKNHEWYEFQLQTSPSKVRRVVAFNIKAHEQVTHLQESKTPVSLKNVIMKNGECIFNQQSSVCAAPNSDISFAYKEQPAPEEKLRNDVSLDVGKISELEALSPNQKVNVKGTLSLGKNKPKMVVIRGSEENCAVKEDCIIEDETGHSVINIWGAAIEKLQDGQSYYFKSLTVKSFQGKVFLSMTPSTSFEETENTLASLKGPAILEGEDKEVFVSKFRMISKLSIFLSCQKCKKRIDSDFSSCVKCSNCGTHQRASECNREGSVKLCIRENDDDLWLTCFTETLTDLLAKTSSVTLENTTDEIAEAIMNAECFFLTFNCLDLTVKVISTLELAKDS